MKRYFYRGPLPQVNSVIHELTGTGAQEYVKAEEFDRVLAERNHFQREAVALSRLALNLRWQLGATGVGLIVALAWGYSLLWQL